MSSPDHRPQHRALWRICAGLVMGIVLAYVGVVGCGFVSLDDPNHVHANELVKPGLTWHGMREAFAHPHGSLWVPLTTISFMADVSLFGMNPAAMHVENVLWHGAAAVLLFLALHRLTGRLWPAAMVAALFGLHPVNVESVAWITERKNVLCGFFFMLALLLWSGWAQRRQRSAWWASLAAFAAALLAKPMAVTFPCLLLLLDAWPLRRIDQVPWRRLIGEKLPFFLLSAGTSFMASHATKARDSMVDTLMLPLSSRITNALCSYVAYLRDLAWPTKLAVFYPHPVIPQWGPALVALIFLLALAAIAGWRWRQQPWLLVGLLMFLGLPMANMGFVQVGSQARADRFIYFAAVGVFIAAVWLADALLPRSVRLRASLAAAVLMACGVVSARQVATWQDDLTLFQRAVNVTERNAMAQESLGYARRAVGDLAGAAQALESSLAIMDDNARCWNELGAYHQRLGNNARAAEAFSNAVRLDPKNAIARTNLAMTLGMIGQPSAAEAHFRQVIAEFPTLPEAHFQYGLMLLRLGRPAEARPHLAEAHRLAPDREAITQAWQQLEPGPN